VDDGLNELPLTSRRTKKPRRRAITATAAPMVPVEGDGRLGRDARGRCWLISNSPPFGYKECLHRSGWVWGLPATPKMGPGLNETAHP
jgi:hypothetical protein